MINLLPPRGKKVMHREYWFRVGTVTALLMAVAFAVGFVFLVPTYVLVRSQSEALLMEVGTLPDMRSKEESAEMLVKETNALATELNRVPYEQKLSDVLASVDRVVGTGISISRVVASRTENGVAGIDLTGNAASREALISFRDALEEDPLFARADVPISDLVRSEGLPFTMSITLAIRESE